MLGQVNRAVQAFNHPGADGVHFGLDAGNQHVAVVTAGQSPQPHRFVLMQRGAGRFSRWRICAQHALRKVLACIDRQAARRHKSLRRRVPRTLRRVHAAGAIVGFGHRAFENPIRQRRVAQRLAGVDVFLHHVGHFQPARFLPQLERPLAHAKTPAQAKINIARVVGNAAQMDGGVVKAVAQNRPQKLALLAFAVAQQFQAFSRWLFQHAAIHLIRLFTGGHISLAGQIKAQDVAALPLEKTGLGFLPQVAHFQQRLQNLGGGKAAVEGIGFKAQGVLQRLDDVAQRVQPHHVGSAEGARTGAAHLFARKVVHHVKRQAVVFDLFQGCQHARDADAVGDEIGRILGPHHAFAQHAGDKCFKLVQDQRLRGGRVDQLHQRHVARRVEEVDAAKTRLDGIGQRLA